MTSTETIYQCARCRRFFAEGRVIQISMSEGLAAARGGNITSFDCHESDCVDRARQNSQEDEDQRQRWRARRCIAVPRAPRRPAPDGRPHPACPPERALPRRSVTGPDALFKAGSSPSENQLAYSTMGVGDSDCEKMLTLLFEKFDVIDPNRADSERASRGRWIPRSELVHTHGIETPNSRASQLRGCDTIRSHPLVKRHRLDVDTKFLNGEWHYSICFIEHSERLAREQMKEDESSQTRLI
jgi:hypothetical protein